MKNIELISNPVLKAELREKKTKIFEQKVNKSRLTELQEELLGEKVVGMGLEQPAGGSDSEELID